MSNMAPDDARLAGPLVAAAVAVGLLARVGWVVAGAAILAAGLVVALVYVLLGHGFVGHR